MTILSGLLRVAEALLEGLRGYRLAARCRRLRQALAESSAYSYSSDYLSSVVDMWPEALAVHAHQPGLRILEVGSYEGRSALWFAHNLCTQADSGVVCVDLFRPEAEIRFDHNIALGGVNSRVTKCKGPSEEVLPRLAGSTFDIVYVDGSHRAADVLLDGTLCWRLLKPGGTLIFDDYLWEISKPPGQRPQMAIDLFLEATAGQWEMVHQGYQVIIRKLKGTAGGDEEQISRREYPRCGAYDRRVSP